MATMLGSTRIRVIEQTLNSPSAVTLPASLIPAFRTAPSRRQFSATANRSSKLGRTPLSIPPGIELAIGELQTKKVATSWLSTVKRKVTVSGPLGKLDLEIPPFVNIDHDEANRKLMLSVKDRKIKQQREMWGTTWSYLQKYILGVSEGHTAVLRLVGIGYRATVEPRPELEEYPGQQFVILKLGFSHPVEMGVPLGMKASTPQQTRILLEGINKEEIMQFAANIRQWRRPEPYKGKGIFVNNETIKLKQKKIK